MSDTTTNKTTLKLKKGIVYCLPRGGYILDSSEGYIQIGSPPETIKDTMFYEKGVPSIFCLTPEFFSRDKGISVAEVEFPIYYNFFLKQQKMKLICNSEQINIFKQVIKESLFGPKNLNIAQDYIEDSGKAIPNMRAELASFTAFKFEDVVEFIPLEGSHPVIIGNVAIKMEDNKYKIIDNDFKLKTEIPASISYQVIYDVGKPSMELFKAPLMGITCLGPSHGFDPLDNTSGFILWLGHTGVMIDPPVNSTEWLTNSNVNPKLINSIILTHTHADHDAGTLQKILEEDRITIYTTKTIMQSWLYKYSTLTQISENELSQLFDFIPIRIGEPVNIKGAWFDFSYMLHSIPTIGFNFKFRGKHFVYSSDHLNSPEHFQNLLKDKVISRERYQELLDFPWYADIIFHESGFAPLHTPVEILNSMPKEVQKKTHVYHIAEKDFPQETNLTLCKFGISETIVLDVKENRFYQAYSIIDMIAKIDLFSNINLKRLLELLSTCDTKNYKANDRVITKGEQDDNLIVIISGSLIIYDDAKNVQKRFGRFQYLGEVSIMQNSPRTVDVYAETDVEVLLISKQTFTRIIKGTVEEKKLLAISKNRDIQSWQTLTATAFFDKMTSSEKTEMETLLERVPILDETLLVKIGDPLEDFMLFNSGKGIEIDAEENVRELKCGDFIGNYNDFSENKPSRYSVHLEKKSLVFRFNRDGFKKFLKNHPGVYLRFFEGLQS